MIDREFHELVNESGQRLADMRANELYIDSLIERKSAERQEARIARESLIYRLTFDTNDIIAGVVGALSARKIAGDVRIINFDDAFMAANNTSTVRPRGLSGYISSRRRQEAQRRYQNALHGGSSEAWNLRSSYSYTSYDPECGTCKATRHLCMDSEGSIHSTRSAINLDREVQVVDADPIVELPASIDPDNRITGHYRNDNLKRIAESEAWTSDAYIHKLHAVRQGLANLVAQHDLVI